MDCPYKDALIPRCQITSHPDRPNIDYCKVCRQWDYIDHVGADFRFDVPSLVWFMISAGVIVMVLKASLPTEPLPRRNFDRPQRVSLSLNHDYANQ